MPRPEGYLYLILHAHNERVREAGVIRTQAALIVIGLNEEERWKSSMKDHTQYVITEKRQKPGAS